MKKSILCVGVLGLSLAVLGACSSNDGGNKTAEESTTTISSSTTTEIQASAQQTSERDVIEMSFKDKTLTGPGRKRQFFRRRRIDYLVHARQSDRSKYGA